MSQKGENMYELNLLRNTFRGKLLVFDGCDGAGKTTLLNEAKHFLDGEGVECLVTKMPSNRIRALEEFRNFHDSHDANERLAVTPLALTVLVSGDRLIVQDTEIIPALEKGQWVLCDRYAYTGLVICSNEIIKLITERFVKPNTVFLAIASAGTLRRRVKSRPNEKDLFYDNKEVERQLQVYEALAEANGFVKISTEQTLDSMFDILHKHLRELLGNDSRINHQ